MGWEKNKDFLAVFLLPLSALRFFRGKLKLSPLYFFDVPLAAWGFTSESVWRKFLRVMKQVGKKPNDVKKHYFKLISPLINANIS